jgi:hypothetical protein
MPFFDLSGRLALESLEDDERIVRYLGGQMAPFQASADLPGSRSPDVVLTPAIGDAGPILEEQGPANDDLTTGTDGRRLYVLSKARRCSIPDALDDGPIHFDHDPGFPLWRVFRTAVRPAMQVALAASGRGVAVHAATVTLDGGAIVVAGWSESGKTETALGLMERGASFLSDKWTLLGSDGLASAFPISIGIRRWVLRYLPTLRSSLTRPARAQFAAAGLASLVLEPVAGRSAGSRTSGFVADGARRAMAIGDRAAFEVAELRAAYGQTDDPERTVPVRLVAALRTVPGDEGDVRVRSAEPGEIAARLARSAAYERRSYFELLQRAGYALPHRPAAPQERAIAADEVLLRAQFERVRVVVVDAPFPTDPRRVADAILAAS